MYEPTEEVIVWRAVLTGGATGLDYNLYVNNNGTAFLRADRTREIYWTIP
jgi:hypothetical protein